MPILSEDIKLLESAVMADTADGGGAMTGNVVVDGASNSLFPDVSEMDLAFGRVNVRLVYFAAHTDDTDTLLGAHAIIEDGPDNPLVNCLLMASPSWGASRTELREKIERNLVKGPRLTSRIMDTHYEGSQLLRLIAFAGTDFPAASDTIVLRNPDETEQYVRIMRITRATQQIAVTEGGSTAVVSVTIATCELAEPLERDFRGPPLQRTLNESAYAQIYTTSSAGGAQFFGIKPLALAATAGDSTVSVADGIFAPLVPANRVERPLQDQYPLTLRQTISRTAQGLLTLPAAAVAMGPGTVLRLPTAYEPGSLSITRGATVFTDDSNGNLRQGAATVGSVDYRGRSIALAAGAPNYGNASTVIALRPATLSGAAVHSDALTITTGTQGLVFAITMEPPPAPGTFSLSYMAQERWYDLVDSGSGKLAGADSSYGSGQLSYATGSASITLGSPPDVGSALIWSWGDASAAVGIAPAGLPTRLHAELSVDGRASPSTMVLEWSRGATDYTATVAADGTLSGDATGRLTPGALTFEPAVLPDGDVTVTHTRAAVTLTTFTNNAGGNYLLHELPVQPGSVLLTLLTVAQAGFDIRQALHVTDNGAGQLVCRTPGAAGAVVGTVNYASGAVVISSTLAMQVYENVVQTYQNGSNTLFYEEKVLRAAHTVALQNAAITNMAHAGGASTGTVETLTPTWQLAVPLLAGLKLATSGVAFTVGNGVYTATAGVLKRGWVAATGAADVENAGSVSDGGVILVAAPPADGVNTVTWFNAAQDMSSPRVGQGVFRTANAPLKSGQFQVQSGALVGAASEAGVISGAGWSGSVDFQRGIVRWSRMGSSPVPGIPWITWETLNPVAADSLSYNAVYFQFMPLNSDLLGMATSRLPIDGKVEVFFPGGLVLVHHTATTVLPNPIVKGTVYSLGRQRLAAVRGRTAAGAAVDGALYQVDLNAGEISFPIESDLTGLAQPFTVHHRIEDLVLVSEADLSGQLKLTRSLTHDFPALTSRVSGVLPVGDLFARAYGFFDQQTWTGVWSDELIGAGTTAEFNSVDYPVGVTNRGAVTERWALIFTSSTAFRIVGERSGQIGTGNVNALAAPINPATGVPFWAINPQSWGAGQATGNVLRFNTTACGAALAVIRTILQGNDATNDSFSIAARGGVNA